MRLSTRSYPHPVIGNADDVPGAAFQATIDVSCDRSSYYIDVSIQCSSQTLRDLVAEGKAIYTLHVECSNTVFRRAYEFTSKSTRIQMPAEFLSDTVELNLFARAVQTISGYRVEGAHSDYGGASFDVGAAEILAVAEGLTFFAENKHDSMKNVGAIMQIVPAPEEGDRPMRADLEGEKILIILSKPDYLQYMQLKQNRTVADMLATAIVLPVLIEAIRQIEKDDSVYENLRWCRRLKDRIRELKQERETDALVKGQMLLEMPIKRAMGAASSLAGGIQ